MVFGAGSNPSFAKSNPNIGKRLFYQRKIIENRRVDVCRACVCGYRQPAKLVIASAHISPVYLFSDSRICPLRDEDPNQDGCLRVRLDSDSPLPFEKSMMCIGQVKVGLSLSGAAQSVENPPARSFGASRVRVCYISLLP